MVIMVIYGYSRKYHSISFSLVTQYVKSCQQSHVRVECCGLHNVHTAKTWQITHISRIQGGISQISKISGKNIRFVALDLKAAQESQLAASQTLIWVRSFLPTWSWGLACFSRVSYLSRLSWTKIPDFNTLLFWLLVRFWGFALKNRI